MDRDLRARLAAEVVAEMKAAKSLPVTWGADDCVMFAANPIKRALGLDPMADYRGAYATRDGAKELIGSLGLGFAMRRAAKRFGWLRIAPQDALSGDIGLGLFPTISGDAALTTLICRAPGWFVARGECGFFAIKSEWVRLAWSVLPRG